MIAKSNYVLRHVLNKEENMDILKDLIEAVLGIQLKKIQLNPYLKEKEYCLPAEENFGIADVRTETKEGEELNIGIQFIDGKYVQTKILIYYAQIHNNQIFYDDDRNIARTTTINILNIPYFESLQAHKKITVLNKNEPEYREEELEFHVLELPKFEAMSPLKMTKEEQWICYLKGDKQEIIEIIKNKNEKIKKLDTLLEEYWKQEKMQ